MIQTSGNRRKKSDNNLEFGLNVGLSVHLEQQYTKKNQHK